MPTAQSAIVQDLTRQLVDGQLPRGSKLPSERQLAARYGVSRNVVREVLSGLADRRMIAIEPGRGAFATGPSAVDASFALERASLDRGATPADLIEARVLLEGRAAAIAAERWRADEVPSLRRLARAVDTPNLLDRAACDLALHLGIAAVARSVVIESLLLSIAPMTAELMLRSLSDPAVSSRGLPLHDDIVDAIARRDAPGAREAVEGHLRVAALAYGADYDRPLEQLAREAVSRLGGHQSPGSVTARVKELVARAIELAAIREDDHPREATKATEP